MTLSDEYFLKEVGCKIAEQRKSKGLSQLDVGAIIEMEKSNLSAIENGRQNTTLITLKKIADAIGCELKDFL